MTVHYLPAQADFMVATQYRTEMMRGEKKVWTDPQWEGNDAWQGPTFAAGANVDT